MRERAVMALAVAGVTWGVAAGLSAAPKATGDGLALVQKFQVGRVAHQEARVRSNVTLRLRDAAGKQGREVPLRTDFRVSSIQEVTAVSPSGEATVKVTPKTMNLTLETGDHTLVLQVANGKASGTADGQPIEKVESIEEFAGLTALVDQPFLQRLSARGEVLEDKPAGTAQEPRPLSPTVGLRLPVRPVSPGESWEDRTTLVLPLPGAPSQEIRVQLTNTSTLKSVEERGGRRIATIESQGKAAGATAQTRGRPPYPESFTSTIEFDATQGELVGARAKMDVDTETPIAAGSGQEEPGSPGPLALMVKGTVEFTVTSR